MQFDSVSHTIIGAAIEVHRQVGPGLLESEYSTCLALEFDARNLRYRAEVPIPLHYRGRRVAVSYRADFVVEKSVIVELKSVQRLEPIHRAQLLTYLKLTGIRIGLLFNFNSPILRNAMVRIVL